MSMKIVPPTKGGDDTTTPRENARSWAMRGQAGGDHSASPHVNEGSAGRASAALTDEAAVKPCYTKKTLAQLCVISIRSLDRANALGLLPCPDLVVGRSPRWSPDTIERWLRTRPRLPGRRGGES